jgi:hypothetical protein
MRVYSTSSDDSSAASNDFSERAEQPDALGADVFYSTGRQLALPVYLVFFVSPPLAASAAMRASVSRT